MSLQLLSGSVVMTTCVQRRLQNVVCCLDELGSAGHRSARFQQALRHPACAPIALYLFPMFSQFDNVKATKPLG